MSLPTFSASISSTHKADGPQRMIERTIAAHEAGLASLTVGDHHNMAVPYAQNTPILGRLLAEWKDRPAGCLFLVPLWPPLLMAEHIGTLAALHQTVAPGQPFIVQTGIGWGSAQFENLDRDMRRRGADIDAAIPVVKALLAGESVTDSYFGLTNAQVGLRSDGPYEWWIGGTADAAIDRAARLGDVWYGSPGQDDDAIKASVDRFKEAGGGRVAMRRDALLGADRDHAHTQAQALVDRGYRGLAIERLLVGDADDLAERADQMADLGVDEIVVRCMASDQELALETLATCGRGAVQ